MSCFGGRDEQLYLLEFTVGRLKLASDKVRDVGDRPLSIKIKFIDFPAFEITRNDFLAVKPTPRDGADESWDFSMGRSCLFVKQPRDLMRAMKRSPLKIGIFCVGDTYPVAESEVPVSGCLCDQVAMAANDLEHRPKPYTLKGAYHLTDPGENPSGAVNLELRVTCLGKLVVTHYRLLSRSFLFRNERDDDEFRVRRVAPPAMCADERQGETMKCGDGVVLDDILENVVEEESAEVNEKKANERKTNETKDENKKKDKKGKKK